jgi:hypothetical protein
LVIGQPDFTTTSNAVTSSKFYRPTGIASDGNRLYIVDYQNSRVMGWNTIPSTSGTPADFVLGQNSFTTNTSNNPTLSSFQGYLDGGIVTDGQKLLVGDSARILVWNTLPTVTGQSADYVIGQSSSTAMVTNQDITWSFDKVYNLFLYGTKLIVSDSLIFGATTGTWIWNTLPTTYNQPKERLLKTLSTSIPKWAGGYRTRIFGTKLYRTASNAVYIWNTIPTSRDTPPDVVLGQPDFNSSTLNYNGLSASSLANPSDVVVIGTKLIVSDDSNQRLLVWNSIPSTNNQAADVVLGQANFTSNSQNRGGSPAANTISGPNSLATDGTKLFVCDGYNRRILIWNTVPTSNGANANIVVGQTSMTAYTSGLSASQSTFYYYYMSISIASNKLIVSEQQGNRVLIWNSVPTTNGAAADVVLGQSDFTSITANSGGLSASSLWGPWNATVYSNKLYVLDSNNHRVLVWNSIPTSSNQPADAVLFQPNFTSNKAHGFGLGYSPFDVYMPFALLINGGKMYVSESYRTLVLDYP